MTSFGAGRLNTSLPMRTLSHLLLTAGLGDQLRKRRIAVHEPAFLLGSVLPDLPLMLLAAGYKLVQRRRGGDARPASAPDRFGIGCHELFHSHPLWISSYNLFHAPLVITALLLAGVQGQRNGAAWGRPLRWLALGLALHSAVDIPTHHDDGPLLLFPVNWRYRWRSPLSYWDQAHGGRAVTTVEYGLDLLLAGYLAGQWINARQLCDSQHEQGKS
jgi:membrane-bound metal-dependent hydrolase YbcI (DUF457 family)